MKFAKLFLLAIIAVGVVSCGMSEEEADAFAAEIAQEMDTVGQSALNTLNDDLEEDEVEPFTSNDGHFSVRFPNDVTPVYSSEVVETDIGPSTLTFYMYEKSNTEVYMVSFNDYKGVDMSELDPQNLLQGGRDGALGSLEIYGTEEEKPLEKQGYPGLYFRANNGQYFVEYEMFLVNERLYQVAILQLGSYPSAEATRNFMDSFTLNDLD